jgi:hypothetical protein
MFDQDRVDHIAYKIRQKNCTPVISNQMVLDQLFGKKRLYWIGYNGDDGLENGGISPELMHQFSEASLQVSSEARVQVETPGEAWTILDGQYEYIVRRNGQSLSVETRTVAHVWADEVNYPLADGGNLTRVAQYYAVESGNLAKWRYLEFLKKRLLFSERQSKGANQVYLDNVEKQMDRLTFTQLAVEQLRRPSFADQPDGNPIGILARLELPVYITTSHHRLLEEALNATGKKARTEAYRWREDLKIPQEFAVDLRYEPTVDSPLVFHLFGIDNVDESLVLTEDDHLDFLVSIMRDFNDTAVIPNHLRDAISTSMLLLLGYEIHGWDLKTFLKGLIEPTEKHPESIAIQIDPADGRQIRDVRRFNEYVQQYFKRVKFEVVWSAPEDFIADLSDRLK